MYSQVCPWRSRPLRRSASPGLRNKLATVAAAKNLPLSWNITVSPTLILLYWTWLGPLSLPGLTPHIAALPVGKPRLSSLSAVGGIS
jgi:hypothetical protein